MEIKNNDTQLKEHFQTPNQPKKLKTLVEGFHDVLIKKKENKKKEKKT